VLSSATNSSLKLSKTTELHSQEIVFFLKIENNFDQSFQGMPPFRSPVIFGDISSVRATAMPPFRSPVIFGNISSVRATATSFENRTFEDIDENGIFPDYEIEEETEIEEENV
jgi:hypothetical protein